MSWSIMYLTIFILHNFATFFDEERNLKS